MIDVSIITLLVTPKRVDTLFIVPIHLFYALKLSEGWYIWSQNMFESKHSYVLLSGQKRDLFTVCNVNVVPGGITLYQWSKCTKAYFMYEIST